MTEHYIAATRVILDEYNRDGDHFEFAYAACRALPAALDQVERLRSRLAEVEAERDKQDRLRRNAGVAAVAALERVTELEAQVEALRAERDRERRHPMAPERCPECEWTNIILMNYGTPGGRDGPAAPRWLCHGCAARLLAERDAMRPVVDAAIDLNSIDDGTEPDGPHLFYAQCEAARLVMLAVDAYQAARPTLKATGEGE